MSNSNGTTATLVERLLSVAVSIIVIMALYWLLTPSLITPPEAAHRTACRHNLKQIGLALHNYYDIYGTFPPAFIADKSGKPMHSWRVLILPYLEDHGEGRALYAQYKFDEPWDGPHNRELLSQRPDVFSCPANKGGDPTLTDYAAIVGAPCIFAGERPVTIPEVRDGTSDTVLVSEAAGLGIPWTAPRDVVFGVFTGIGDPGCFDSEHDGGVFALIGYGWVRFFSDDMPLKKLRAQFTRAGGESVP